MKFGLTINNLPTIPSFMSHSIHSWIFPMKWVVTERLQSGIWDLSFGFVEKIRPVERRGICRWGTEAFNTCRGSVFDTLLWECTLLKSMTDPIININLH